MRGRRGQAAVLVGMLLMVLMLLVALSTNIGIAVNDRIRMQQAADLSTYAVAYSEAASLNELAELNARIADAVQQCRETLTSTIWNTEPCACLTTDSGAEMVIDLCKDEVDFLIMDFVTRASYGLTVTPALMAGQATAYRNFRGSESNTTFFEDVPGSPTKEGTYQCEYGLNSGGGGGSVDCIADYVQVDDTYLNYQYFMECDEYCTPILQTRTPVPLKTWFYKETSDPDIWVAGRVAGTPSKRFLDIAFDPSGSDGGYFGASSTGGTDLLVAYAVAKPYDGSVGPSREGGNTRSGNNMGLLQMPHGIEFPLMTMVEEYRARMAGINDGLAGETTPAELVEQDASNFGERWAAEWFEH
jgi:hypothetical protein